MTEPIGVVLEATSGRRSSTALGRAVVADALGAVDEVAAGAARAEQDWRTGYPPHFRRLVELSSRSDADAEKVARAGLAALADRMRWRTPDGQETPLTAGLDRVDGEPLRTVTVHGTGTPETDPALPWRGRRLTGADLRDRVADWVRRGIVEPDVADAVATVQAHPEWLRLEGRTVVLLGAGSEVGPLRPLLRWGATVAGVARPGAGTWAARLEEAGRSAGTLHVPAHRTDGAAADRAGADLLTDAPRIARWIADLPGPLVLGNHLYADGVENLRLSAVSDAVAARLLAGRDDVALAYLATPSDAYALPADVVADSRARYAGRSWARVTDVVRRAAGDRVLRPAHRGADSRIVDAIQTRQGPNYLLAKHVHRWRATAAAADGHPVSFLVAPPARTRSVVKNAAIAAAYRGFHRFGLEVFEPDTASALMAMLLVHDLHTTATGHVAAAEDPTRASATGRALPDGIAHAVHGGFWRTGYDPASVLDLAALVGTVESRLPGRRRGTCAADAPEPRS